MIPFTINDIMVKCWTEEIASFARKQGVFISKSVAPPFINFRQHQTSQHICSKSINDNKTSESYGMYNYVITAYEVHLNVFYLKLDYLSN